MTNISPIQPNKQPTWIWYPGDYEIWLGNQMQNRRTERGAFFPPFWKLDSHYVLVDFMKKVNLPVDEEIEIFAEGDYNVKIDSRMLPGRPSKFIVPAGERTINIKIYCLDRVPALYVKGNYLASDDSWATTYEDKEWIDMSGKVSDKSATSWQPAGRWHFNEPGSFPSEFALATESRTSAEVERIGNSALVDFSRNTFGFVKFHGLAGKGKASLFYGESREEALSSEFCETLDVVEVNQSKPQDYTLNASKAFRYVHIQTEGDVRYDSVSMLYEYLPLEYRGSFRCNDDLLNRIWEVAAYTMHLTTREFFIDGIKRDRWVWSGDAYQSYLMNYYLFFDSPSVRRTLLLQRGKEPVTSHINTIMDYSFYWFLGIYDYYLYTGDKKFIELVYPRMVSLMEFCLGRRNENGLMVGLEGDWVFIDWAEGLSKQGEVSFEQLLFARSLETMALTAGIVGNGSDAERYSRLADDLRKKLMLYWSSDKNAIVHSRVNGQLTENVTRYSNMFAIFFDYFSETQKQAVKESVLLNDKVQKITTPYMRFYELEALCSLGEHRLVLEEMRNYWGGMLNLGATTFWEKFDPNDQDHLAMYGRPFGKSLCHAWGASPIYLLGKYYMGVKPTAPGYGEYVVTPELGGLEWIDGIVPTPGGDIRLFCNASQIKISSDVGTGILRFKSHDVPKADHATIVSKGGNIYEMQVEKGMEYVLQYRSHFEL